VDEIADSCDTLKENADNVENALLNPGLYRRTIVVVICEFGKIASRDEMRPHVMCQSG
jgi:hypothetical protein